MDVSPKKRKVKKMKKFLAIFVAMLLLTVTCMSVVAADPESYLWFKFDGTGSAPGIQLVLGEEELSFLEAGKQYSVFANVWYSEDATGNVYVNYYAYETADSAASADWSHMNSFMDFAKASEAGDKLGTWAVYESPLVNFGIDSYQGDGSDIGCKGMTLGVGYWEATGEVRVASFGIKDADGNVVYELKLDSLVEGKYNGFGMTEDVKGTVWGIEGEKVVEPETPEVDPPATGDMTMVFALIAMVSVAGAAVVAKKRG